MPFFRSFVVATNLPSLRREGYDRRPCYPPLRSVQAVTLTEPTDDPWLERLRALHAIAQEGLTYAGNPFDASRYERLRAVVADMASALDGDAAAPQLAGASLDGGDPSVLRMAFERERGYLTPKLDVRAAVFDADGRILMVRETSDGGWTPPGGWADIGQTLGEGAVREVVEESGYVVEVDRLLGIYDRERWGHPPMPWWTLKAVVACRLVGGTATLSAETDGVDWFAADELPELSLPRCSPQLLARMFEHHADPTLPADL
jgi:ADP-ribose pyrophosphatase YjhB (NUDIX family)